MSKNDVFNHDFGGAALLDCVAQVEPNVAESIQVRINAALPGDTISIPPGFRGPTANGPFIDQRGAPRPIDGNFDGLVVSDIGAFEAGSIPSLRIQSIEIVSGNEVRLIFEGLAGRAYTVETTSTLANPEWAPIGQAVPVTSNLYHWSAPTVIAVEGQFFRAVER